MSMPKTQHKEIMAVLEQIDFHLKKNDLAQLEKTINESGVSVVLSNDTLAKARAMRNSNLVLLLTSLAVDAGVDAATAKVWQDIYLSIKAKHLVGKIAALEGRNILRAAVERIIAGHTNESTAMRHASGSEQEAVDAFELACDHAYWDLAQDILTSRTHDHTQLRACLSMANSIMKRQVRLRNEVGHRYLALFLEQIIQCGGTRLPVEVRTSLQTLMAGSQQNSGQHALALDTYRALDPTQSNMLACSEIARAHCKLGNLEQAIAFMDRAITLLIRNKSGKDGSKPLPLILQTPAEANYTVGRATTALRDLANLAQQAGQDIFLASGTLLGYAREGNLMSHDKDVDLGIIGHHGVTRMVQKGLESRRFHISPAYLKAADTVQVPFIHVPTGIWIDLFVYQEHEGTLVTGVDFQFGYRQKFRFTPFDLVPIQFMGIPLHVPADIDLNLTENFGDWRRPDPSYISHLESPSTMDKGGLEHLLTARMWIIKAIQDGNFVRLKKALDCLTRYPDRPGAAPALMLSQANTYMAQALASTEPGNSGERYGRPCQSDELVAH